jgi:hypothetical protein
VHDILLGGSAGGKLPGKIGKGEIIKRVNASINDYEKK